MCARATVAVEAVFGAVVNIDVLNKAFNPADVTVEPGDTLKWTSRDATQVHQVVCDDPTAPFPFSGNNLNSPGAYFTLGPIKNVGKWNYRDSMSPALKGSFTGRPARTARTAPTSKHQRREKEG